MNAEIFAEWLRQQDHHIVRTASSYWHSQGPRVYQAFPYHWVIQPTEEELNQFLRQEKVIGLRYSTNMTDPSGQISYHAILEESSYGFENLGKWARKNVRHGLKNCSVEPISFQRLADEGWLLQLDTLDRQGRNLEIEKSVWQKRCLVAGSLPGFEAWGALVEGKLAASVITFQMDDCAYMLYQQCHREYLAAHVNNALGFVVTETLMKRAGISSILYGLHSLDAPPSVDEFKFRMGYQAKPVRQRVLFHPWLKPLFNQSTHTVLRKAVQKRPSHAQLAKTEGMMRFYLEGQRSLAEQVWPEVLLEQKEAILNQAP